MPPLRIPDAAASRRRSSARQLLSRLAADVDPDDGVDPRLLARRAKPSRSVNGGAAPRLHRLCGELATRLGVLLAAADDPLLAGLIILRVTPTPRSGHFWVVVAPGDGSPPTPAGVARLEAATPWLRTELAAALVRRKAPHIELRLEPLR